MLVNGYGIFENNNYFRFKKFNKLFSENAKMTNGNNQEDSFDVYKQNNLSKNLTENVQR